MPTQDHGADLHYEQNPCICLNTRDLMWVSAPPVLAPPTVETVALSPYASYGGDKNISPDMVKLLLEKGFVMKQDHFEQLCGHARNNIDLQNLIDYILDHHYYTLNHKKDDEILAWAGLDKKFEKYL